MSKRIDYNQVAPAGMKALGGVYGYVLQSSLPPELVELVYLRVSQINNCAYCLDMHTRDLLKKGQKIEKLALVQALGGSRTFVRRARARRPGLGRNSDPASPKPGFPTTPMLRRVRSSRSVSSSISPSRSA